MTGLVLTLPAMNSLVQSLELTEIRASAWTAMENRVLICFTLITAVVTIIVTSNRSVKRELSFA